MSRPIFSDIESPAMKSQEIDNLKTNSKRTGICTAVAFVFGFIGFCMAAAAVAGVRQLMIDSQVKTGAILTVGNASPLKGHSKAHSLYAGSGQWTSKTVLPENLSDFQAVSHKTHVYVIGGQDDQSARRSRSIDLHRVRPGLQGHRRQHRVPVRHQARQVHHQGGDNGQPSPPFATATLPPSSAIRSTSSAASPRIPPPACSRPRSSTTSAPTPGPTGPTWPPVAPTPARPSSAARSTSSPATSPSTRSTFSTPSRFWTPPLRPPRGRLLRVSPPSAATSPAPPPAARFTPSADTTTPPARGQAGRIPRHHVRVHPRRRRLGREG